MNNDVAYSLAAEPEPSKEDHVDLFCPACDGAWADCSSAIFSLADKHPTVFNNYVGNEHCHLEDTDKFLEYFTCPNGCQDLIDSPVRLIRFDENHRATPWQQWKRASIIEKMIRLQDSLSALESELKTYPED